MKVNVRRLPSRFVKSKRIKITSHAEFCEREAGTSEHLVADIQAKLFYSATYMAYIAAEEYGKEYFRCMVAYLPVATGLLQKNAVPVSTGKFKVSGYVKTTALGFDAPVFGWEDPLDWRTREAYDFRPDPDLVSVIFFIPYKNWKAKPMKEISFSIQISREAYDEPEFVEYARLIEEIEGIPVNNYNVVALHYEQIEDSLNVGRYEFETKGMKKAKRRSFEKSKTWIKRHIWK